MQIKFVFFLSMIINFKKNLFQVFQIKQISILQLYHFKPANTMKIIALVFLIVLFSKVQSVYQGDWVDTFDLPIGFLTHPFYAGYLNLTSTQSYYYNFFPSESNPQKDPLIVRLSAGPGCSALYSAFYSKGPFIFVKNTKNFRVNPFNWNKQANVLFIEGPAGVGFSKGADLQYNDQRAALQFGFAIQRFYQKFPQLKDQTMYLTGQQYAGVVIPRLAEAIVIANRDPNTPAWQRIKLGGLLLNNPCTMGDQCDSHNQFTSHTIRYLRNKYFISEQLYQNYTTHCTLADTQCQNIKKTIESNFLNTGSDLNNIFTQCVQQEGDIKCFDQIGIVSFLNDPKVKEDMHADASLTWKMCNMDIRQKWIRDPARSFKIYQRLLTQEHQLKIWIVSGVLSAAIPITGTKRWFQQLKHEVGLSTTRMWEPWYYNQTVNAGDIQQIRGMSLITVRSGGNHLWNDQPELGYHILDTFLKGTPL